jgi:Rrf2 family protein
MIEIARRQANGPVKRKDIAEAEGLSMGFLENILCVLKDKGIIGTIRGARGGFILKIPPESITLLELVNALESEQAPLECLEEPQACSRVAHCAARNAWKRVYDAQRKILAEITLRDLVDMDKSADALDYAI